MKVVPIVFSMKGCPHCDNLKNQLKEANIEFKEIDTEDKAATPGETRITFLEELLDTVTFITSFSITAMSFYIPALSEAILQ